MNELQKKIIIMALDNMQALSEWEIEFINSLADHDEYYQLSVKQNHQLNRIWEKIS